jgi:hypothetical protein
MVLRLEDGSVFAQGACTYRYDPATEYGCTPCIIVPVRIEEMNTEAVVDTGGLYLICNPELRDLVNPDPANSLGTGQVKVQGVTISGTIHRLSLTLQAITGESLSLEVTALMPDPQSPLLWDLPAYMGMFGCLERMRFAVDPNTDIFYFGSLSGA